MPGFPTKKGAWQNWLTDRTAAVGLCYSLPGQQCNSKEWKESSKQVQSQEKVWATSPPPQAEGWQDYSMYKEGYRVERQKNWACAEAFGSEEHKQQEFYCAVTFSLPFLGSKFIPIKRGKQTHFTGAKNPRARSNN